MLAATRVGAIIESVVLIQPHSATISLGLFLYTVVKPEELHIDFMDKIIYLLLKNIILHPSSPTHETMM